MQDLHRHTHIRATLKSLNRRHLFFTTIILLAGLLAVGPGGKLLTSVKAASTYFVRTDGSDAVCNGLSNASAASAPNCAFQTITKAFNTASNGDTIRVGPGTFTEFFGNFNKSLTMLGNQAGVDARTRVAAAETIMNHPQGAFNVTANNVVIDGFTLQNNTNSAFLGFAIAMGNGTSTGTQVLNNIIQNNVSGIGLSNTGGSQVVVRHNLIQNNNQPDNGGGAGLEAGIYSDQFVAGGTLSNVLIEENKIVGHNDSGISLSSDNPALPATNIVIRLNEFTNNGRAFFALNLTNSSFFRNTLNGATGSATADIRLGEGVSGLSITENFLNGGAGRGMRISNFATGAPNATGVTLGCNSIQNYATGIGLAVDAASYTGTLTATNNWWGSSTGPTNPNNPGGTGQAIVDPENHVVFKPFLTTGTDGDPNTPGFQCGCALVCPANITVSNTPGLCSATVTYPSPTDNGFCGPVVCNPPSGSSFNVGTTTVTCMAPQATPCSNLVGLTTNNTLVIFEAATPGTLTAAPVAITGLAGGDLVVGIDFRPSTGVLYGLGVNGAVAHLYTINVSTGVATQVGGNIALPQSAGVVAGTAYGFDFNPVVDLIRVMSNTRDNFRLNPNTGAVAGVDTALTAGSQVVGGAYTNNFSGATQTTLYGIDFNTDQLVLVGSVNGTPNSPNTGIVTTVGNLGVNTSSQVGFDVSECTGTAYASLTVGGVSGLYTVNLTTGAATLVGTIGGGVPINGLAVMTTTTLVQVSCPFTIRVNDTEKPTITCPPSQIVGTASASGTAVSYAAPSVNDNCPGVGAPVCAPASGSNFPVGVTTVNCSVQDAAGNTNTCSFTITVNRITHTIVDQLACAAPGDVVNGTFTITNSGTSSVTVRGVVTFQAGLAGLPGSCSANVVTTCVVTAAGVDYTATLAAGQTATVNYQAQVTNSTPLCADLQVGFGGSPPVPGPPTVTACVSTANCVPIGPGILFPPSAEVSDQKPGSVLFYNLYSSSISAPNAQNTRVSITNVNPSRGVAVHLFFVDGATCSIADSLVCLTPNQTASFLASDIDPGTTGYIIAVASDTVTGCPIDFNFLIGDEYVKLASGHAANLTAETFAALPGGLPACNASSVTTVLNFDGTSYNRAPRVLAASNIPSRADGNDTLIVLNRVGGSLASGAATLGSLFGIMYDDAENPLSFTFTAGVCQFRSSLSSSFPRTAPRFEQFIPAGRSGWAKFYSLADIGLLGAQINFNPNTGTSASAFNQGHNLHKLTLTSSAVLTIPIFPPNC